MKYKKKQIPWNKGIACTEEMKKRISDTLISKGIKPKIRFVAYGNKHPLWKGEKVSYSGLHYWLYRVLGQPKICSFCGDTMAKKYEWACISGEYTRDPNNYIRLCCSCHKKYDHVLERGWETKQNAKR